MLKIGFISPHSPLDQNSFSGTTYYMYQSLCALENVTVRAIAQSETSKQSKPLDVLTKLRSRNITAFGAIEALIGLMEEIRYEKIRNVVYAESANYDVLVAAVASDIIGGMEDSKNMPPILFVTDATYKFLEEEYSWYMSERHKRNEDNTIRCAELVIYSSEFMADRARKDFDPVTEIREEKFSFIPFGPNMELLEEPTHKNIDENEVRLLFIAKDWKRKGGDIALEVCRQLRQSGFNATLDIVGCNPPLAKGKEWVNIHPFIDKNVPEQRVKFNNLMERSHFLLLPTRADCTPMVIAEANAFGVPALVTSVGGIPTLVNNGETGFLLDFEDGADAYARIIAECQVNQQYYAKVSKQARELYERKLNWNAWARAIVDKAESMRGDRVINSAPNEHLSVSADIRD